MLKQKSMLNTKDKIIKLNSIEFSKFKTIADNVSDSVIITDSDEKALYLNRIAQKNTGFAPDEVLDKSVDDLRLWGEHQHFEIWQTLLDKKPFHGEVVKKRKNGRKYIAELHIYPIIENDLIEFFVSIEKDVTQAREIDRSKTDFIALCAHQLRTPLTNISLSIDCLLGDPDNRLNLAQKETLEEACHDIYEMADLIKALLDASKIQMGTFISDRKAVDIKKLIKKAIRQIEPHVRTKKISLTSKFDPNILEVRTDENIIKVVLQNLLHNAAKFTPAEGNIKLTTKKTAEGIQFAIHDSGWGVPQDKQKSVFQEHCKSNSLYSGSGVGLYLSKLLLSAINGKIWFDSRQNSGAAFYFTVPA